MASSGANEAMPFRVGIIGGGLISEQHLTALSGVPQVEVVGVCDLSESLARFTASRFGVEQWFSSYQQMIQETGCNVVHVLTPPATHDFIVRDCIERGCDIFVEKPVSLSNSSFNELWDFAKQHDVRLTESQNYRFNAPIVGLREAVSAGALGTVEEVEIRMALPIADGGRLADKNAPHPSHRLPAGALHEFITHLSYLFMEHLPNQSTGDIDVVRGAWRNHRGGELFKYDDLDAFIVAGRIHGRIRFAAGQFPDCFSVAVRGTKGHGYAELFQPTLQITRSRPVGKHLTPFVNSWGVARANIRTAFSSLWRKVRNRNAYEGLHRFVAATYAAWDSGSQPPVGYTEMNEVTKFVDLLLAQENQF